MSDVITFENDIADDGAGNEPGLFDDDDPFNLPPPLPPLSPQRDDDPINQDGDGDQTAGNSDKKEPNKKRRVQRSPRPKLDEVRLCNDRGIPALRHICDGIKFKGKGHEASDLTILMQRYEHWAHRLFPKFPFVDVVAQVENLGGKKLVQNCIKRIRQGEEETVEDDDKSDTEIGQNVNGSQADGTPQEDGIPTTNNMQTFGVDVEARDKMVILTPELQERIRLNRERALAKRKAAQEKQAQQENTQTGQTDEQTVGTEQAELQSTDNDGIARDDDATQHRGTENNHSVQTNDIEMEIETTEANNPLPEDSELESETNAVTATPTPIESTNESASVDKDIEMGNNESEGFVTGDVGFSQNADTVSGAESGNIDGATVDNDLPNSTKDLPPRKDDSELVNSQQLEEKFPSSSSVDQPADRGLDDGALQQEGCKETLNAPPTGQAPDQNEPECPQSMEIETEQ